HATDQRLELRKRRHRLVAVLDARRRPDGLDERPERDAVAVGQATAAEHERGRTGGDRELVDQPGLPDTGLAEYEQAARPAGGDDLLECMLQRIDLARAADERLARGQWVVGERVPDPEESERRDGLRLSLQRQRLELLDGHDPSNE